jgi:hypothetical protein
MTINFTHISANKVNDLIDEYTDKHNVVPVAIKHTGTIQDKIYSVEVTFK